MLQNRMPRIPYRATNLSGAFAHLNTCNGEITVTCAQLVWAAITAGKAAGDEYAYGIYSTLERLHRASMMRSYLMQTTAEFIARTMPYQVSDLSEKTAISFYLGMTLATLFAESLFDVPPMLHFAVYGQNYQIVAAQGESRPDLIDLSNSGAWYVIEAKGRSNAFNAAALSTAKEQAEQILSIDNLAPVCSVACQAYFSSTGLSFRMDDVIRPDIAAAPCGRGVLGCLFCYNLSTTRMIDAIIRSYFLGFLTIGRLGPSGDW